VSAVETIKSVIVSVEVSDLRRTDLIFVDPGVMINGSYYREVFLTRKLLPVMQKICERVLYRPARQC